MRDMHRRLAAVVATAALGLGVGAGTASAGSAEMPSVAALFNGATMLGCQQVPEGSLAACGSLDLPVTDDPAILTVNPFTTDIVILGGHGAVAMIAGRKLAENGHKVTSVIRSAEISPRSAICDSSSHAWFTTSKAG